LGVVGTREALAAFVQALCPEDAAPPRIEPEQLESAAPGEMAEVSDSAIEALESSTVAEAKTPHRLPFINVSRRAWVLALACVAVAGLLGGLATVLGRCDDPVAPVVVQEKPPTGKAKPVKPKPKLKPL
jgi:hypothetical protein